MKGGRHALGLFGCHYFAGGGYFAFIVQNREVVTMSFLSFSVHAPLAIMIAAIYVIGAITGGSLFALLRRSYRGSQRNPGQ